MNQKIDAASIDAITTRFEAFVPVTHKGGKRGRQSADFAERPEGRHRRQNRHDKAALRSVWLDGGSVNLLSAMRARGLR